MPKNDTPTEPETEAAEPAGPPTVEVEHKGIRLDFPATVLDWPYEAGLAMEQGQNLKFLQLLLPPDQHRRLVASRLTVGEAQAIVGRAFAAIEARNAGESSAS